MEPIDTAEIKERIDLLSLAERYTKLEKESATEYSGACPKCGGEDRFHVKADGFFCRQCHPKWGDAIEFVRWLEPGLGFREAVERLAGGSLPTAPSVQPRSAPTKEQSASQAAAWAQEAAQLVNQAHARLWGPGGAAGREYLGQRGFHSGVWLMYKLGYMAETPTSEKAPAIVLPWYRGGKIAAVRFRFLNPETGQAKIKGLTGSKFAGLVYGGQALDFEAGEVDAALGALRTLVLCEGEINAMSIWQVANETRLDALSLGSESAKLSPAMIDYARNYGTILTWFDKPEVASAVAGALPGAYAIASPQGKDANDWLQEGRLGGLLSTARLRACRGQVQRERLLWDLWDAADGVQGVDTGTAQVIRRLAVELGRTAAIYEPEPGRWISGVVQ